ncbi:ATP-grasp fold amidoligase family protein, partial [uncultured Eudoraea sp.]|uniref:ATP-grasp fold amidoligase family protein n=1 Tax=uncultured Eudoraea sp. TaxID=1035614 RepID=UPI002601949E
IPKPKPLKKMIDSARVLAEDFKYVRVDFYVVDDKLYFGELTFNPCNGFGVFEPPSMDYEFGKLLQL